LSWGTVDYLGREAPPCLCLGCRASGAFAREGAGVV